MRAEHAFQAGQGIDTLSLRLEIVDHPASPPECELGKQGCEDDRYGQCENSGESKEQALVQERVDAEIINIAHIEHEGFAGELREAFQEPWARDGQPGAAEQHDGGRAGVLGAQHVPLLGGVDEPLFSGRVSFFAGGFLAHRAITLSVWSSASPTRPVNWS